MKQVCPEGSEIGRQEESKMYYYYLVLNLVIFKPISCFFGARLVIFDWLKLALLRMAGGGFITIAPNAAGLADTVVEMLAAGLH